MTSVHVEIIQISMYQYSLSTLEYIFARFPSDFLSANFEASLPMMNPYCKKKN